ncbi:MAG TPA: glycosyltransferase family 39 protein [Bacteroidales bacterium]|nr:glycosyltransferase family 39 protein [Bacteroidales bacterium]
MIKNKSLEALTNFYDSKYFNWIIIFVGILIRFRQYLFNRSLWLDEAFLALNILKLNYTGLLGPLLHGHAAPPLFLLITKLFTDIAGYSEYVLRFFPFLCGIISLLFFYQLAKHILQKQVIPVAIGLLSFSYYAVYYSNEFKQYSVDLLFTILLIFFAFKLDEEQYQKRVSIYFGFIAILSTLFSHTSLFVLSGVLSALFYELLIKNNETDPKKFLYCEHLKKLIVISFLSISSFAFHYFLIIRKLPKNHFYEFWSNGFIPFPPTNLSDVKWYLNETIGILKNPIGFGVLYGLAFIFLLMGIYGFWIRKEKIYFNLLAFPLVVLILASVLQIYPINGRLVLFIIPIIYILISEGMSQFVNSFCPHARIIGILISAFLLLYPVFLGLNLIIKPIQNEEIKPVIQYCLRNKQEEDKIYIYYGAKTAFEYYTWNNNIYTLNSIGSNREKPEEYLRDLDKLKGTGRVWFLFSHTFPEEEKLYLTYLNYIAVPLDSFQTVGSSIYLYKL